MAGFGTCRETVGDWILEIWGDLGEMLDHVSHHKGVTYVTNGQLYRVKG